MSTMLHRLSQWAESLPNDIAQRYKSDGRWKSITSQEYWNRVFHLAAFLESRGFKSQDVGMIFSYNNPQWVHTQLGVQLLGGLATGIYPNSSAGDIKAILELTQSPLLAVQNETYYKKVLDAFNQKLPSNVKILLVLEEGPTLTPNSISYEKALEEGKVYAEKNQRTPAGYLARLKPEAATSIIFTSGTTGVPKGGVLSHENLPFASDVASDTWRLKKGGEELFSFLPLCHVAEQIHCVGVGISRHYKVSFCSKFESVATELAEVQPTKLLCVPRVWEKMMESVKKRIEAAPLTKRKLVEWAMQVRARDIAARYQRTPRGFSDVLAVQAADGLVLKKIRKALGLAKADLCASGAAKLSADVVQWFRSIGVDIQEDYGQTETTAILCMTLLDIDCKGTVGRPARGTEFKIAEDGEILTRGRHIFLGYYKNDAATREVIDSEGWLHTGDLGEWVENGLVRIKGRKKEILKTSGGKMVAPLPIEEKLKQYPPINQVCVVGDGRKYLSVLITLDPEYITKNGFDKGKSPILQDSKLVTQIGGFVEEVNQSLASFEKIKYFRILREDFTIERGEMTPTLKMKRNIIESNYRSVINDMYPAGELNRSAS